MAELTWETIYQYWRQTKEQDWREEEIRHYLAIGIAAEKTLSKASLAAETRIERLLEGEGSLMESYFYYRDLAIRYERQLQGKEAAIQEKETAIHEKEAAIQEKERAITEKHEAMMQLHEVLQKRQSVIEELDEYIQKNCKENG